jgi:hypothetical protein
LNPELWNVEITLSSTLASTGTMTIRQEHAAGGTFDAQIYLQPYFTFTRVSDSTVLTLDGAGMYEDLLQAVDVPWVYADPGLTCPACVTNFIPGHDGVSPVDFVFVGTASQHTVRCGCISGEIPTLSQWGLIVLAGTLLALGGYTIARRRRTADGIG